jgi:hypothetical protein
MHQGEVFKYLTFKWLFLFYLLGFALGAELGS